MKPLIGITAGAMFNRDHTHEPLNFGQIHEYADAISGAGGVPVILPIARSSEETADVFARLDGILFAGGNDVAPHLYGQENRDAGDVDEARDRHESDLMRMALDARMPMLAICRGMQLMNVVHGGTMYQDIAKEVPDADNHRGYVGTTDPAHLAHTLAIVPETKLSEILGLPAIRSNSRHHQAVKDIGAGLIVNARAEDGIIEGIEGTGDHFMVGVQPHPESLINEAQPEWKPLFAAFVAAAVGNKQDGRVAVTLPSQMKT